MKTNHHLFILILTGFLCLPIKTSHAQGNLLVNTSWTVQQALGGGVFINNSPTTGIYPVGFTYNGGSISQTVSTTPDANYDLTFRGMQQDGNTASYVFINGNVLANLNFPDDPFVTAIDGGGPYNTIWENFDFSFTALSANTTISFTEYPEAYGVFEGPDNSFNVYYSDSRLDSISVTTVPEPSSLALLGVGLFAATKTLLRRRK
jgi:hypothetical protein